MANQILFQVLVDVGDKEVLSECIVLPKIVRDKLSAKCKRVKLVDHSGREYTVSLVSFSDSRLMLTGSGWRAFVHQCIPADTTKLCFRLRRSRQITFDVVVFDSEGKQIVLNANGNDFIKTCIIEVTGETIYTEYPPYFFLDDLNGEYRRKPDKTATIFGANQIEDVDVIYEYEDEDGDQSEEDEDTRMFWRALGFTGPKWMNLCFQHDVAVGDTIMLTNVGEGTYLFDVFNEKKVGSDAATVVSREVPQSKKPTLTDEYVTESEGEQVESLRHNCNVADHIHYDERPCTFKKLTDHSFTSKMLTLPIHFVRNNHLDTYKRARVFLGSLEFPAKLKIVYDKRKNGDQSHVVLVTDWWKISKKTGVGAGKELRLELNLVQLVDGPVVEFHVC